MTLSNFSNFKKNIKVFYDIFYFRKIYLNFFRFLNILEKKSEYFSNF